MPTPEELEVGDLFLRKAASDRAAAQALAADHAQLDDVVGFHAEQAVEKALKAVLAVRGLEIPRTHDLVLLIRLVEAGQETIPEDVKTSDWLGPWAVTMRYDEVAHGLERERAVRVATAAVSWARELVDSWRSEHSSPSPEPLE